MQNTTSKPKGGFRLVAAAGILFFIIAAFISGFYFGIWQTIRRQYNLSVADIIRNAPAYVFSDQFDASLFLKVWQSVQEKYVGQPVNDKAVFYGALGGMVRGLDDPYSVFLDPQETTSFNKELSGTFEGIGAEIGIKNEQLTLIAPLPHSPALEAGLKAGDKIFKIDGQDTADMTIDQAIGFIRGPKGTTVVLTVLSSGAAEARDVAIKRDEIKVESVTWEMKGDVVYVQISHFNSETDGDFKHIIPAVLLAAPRGIILDLRNNPGGYLDAAINVAGEFLEKKVIVLEDFGKSQKEYKSTGTAQLKDVATVVLVNQGSASASEIVAGALQDYGRATVIGEQTFGKGTVQDFEEFSDGSSLKLTVAKWLTPKGRSIDEAGIAPDVAVALTEDDYNRDADPQLDRALEMLRQ